MQAFSLFLQATSSGFSGPGAAPAFGSSLFDPSASAFGSTTPSGVSDFGRSKSVGFGALPEFGSHIFGIPSSPAFGAPAAAAAFGQGNFGTSTAQPFGAYASHACAVLSSTNTWCCDSLHHSLFLRSDLPTVITASQASSRMTVPNVDQLHQSA